MREAERRASSWLAAHAGGLVALVFFAHGLATLTDYGVTWDEQESYRAGAQNLRLIAAAVGGEPLPRWPWHELPGYQFVADTARAAIAAVVNRLFWEPGSYLGFHLVNLIAAALVVWLVARIAWREGSLRPALASTGVGAGGLSTGAVRSDVDDVRRESGSVLAPLAALLLVVQPKLVAHSQANPKDIVGLLAFTMATLVLLRAARRGRWSDYAVLGLAIGAALASHVSGILLLPLALVWTATAGIGSWRRRLGGLAFAGALAAPTALALWPWLWPAPWQRAQFLLDRVQAFDVSMRVLYLGEVYRPSELPWHYGIMSLAIATPVPLLLAALAGLVYALRRGPAARLCRLAALWLALFVVADLRAPAHYDGARHLLPALPAVALLAAGGVYGIGCALRRGSPPAGTSSPTARRRSALLLAALFAASLLGLAVDLAAVHPYADAYLNTPARLALGPEAQRRVELEYWGNSYKEGAEWLARHAPRGSFVFVPLGSHAAAPFLAGRFELVPHDGWRDGSRPQYLMLMTREAWYTPRLRRIVDTRRPLHVVRRQGSTLLAIYRVEPMDGHPR